MRKANCLVLVVVVFTIAFAMGSWYSSQQQTAKYPYTVTTIISAQVGPNYEVYFSPNGGCEARLLYWIGRANSSIHIMIYSFTLDTVGDALIAANKRNVDVRIVMEKSEIGQGSEYEKMKRAGIQVRLDTNPAIMHNKVAIIDGTVVITGSYNWSASAETRNDENLIIIRSAQVAAEYEKAFQKIWNQSTS